MTSLKTLETSCRISFLHEPSVTFIIVSLPEPLRLDIRMRPKKKKWQSSTLKNDYFFIILLQRKRKTIVKIQWWLVNHYLVFSLPIKVCFVFSQNVSYFCNQLTKNVQNASRNYFFYWKGDNFLIGCQDVIPNQFLTKMLRLFQYSSFLIKWHGVKKSKIIAWIENLA